MADVLVTGVTGFLGNHLVSRLVSDNTVWALVRRIPEGADPRIRWIIHDLARAAPIVGLPRRADVVVHLAQSRNYRSFPVAAPRIYAVSVATTAALLDWAVRAGVERFILASTGGVYGYASEPVGEDAPIDLPKGPLAYYFATKLMAEDLLGQYRDLLCGTVLRYFFMYGPNQSERMLLPRLQGALLCGEAIRLHGRDGLNYNPLHISDAVAATVAAIQGNRPGTFNIAGPEPTTLRRVCEALAERLEVVPQFECDAGLATPSLIADIARASAELAIPKVSLDAGLADLVEKR